MSNDLYAGIDLGTSGIKIVIADKDDRIVASASRAISTRRLHEGWNEQHPDDWWAAVCDCFDELAPQKKIMARVKGIGLSGQMLGIVLIDKHDNAIRRTMLWNDGRAVRECEELLGRIPDIGMRANGTPDPGLGAPKLLWLARHEPNVLKLADCLLLPKDYVRLKLTGERLSEPSDAGGTMLLECATGTWSGELCTAAEWDLDRLPALVKSWDKAGELQTSLSKRFNLPKNLPIAAGAGDNMACSLGVGVAQVGDSAVTIGTSGVICTVDDSFNPLPSDAILTSHHAAPDVYLSMGVVMSATASFEWLATLLGESTKSLSAKVDKLYQRGEAFASPICAPWLNGIRTPHNQPAARGIFSGVSLSTDASMLGWSIFEGVAFQFRECLLTQQKAGMAPDNIALVGGGSNSKLWCTLIATLLDQTVTLPQGRHLAACLGATRLAQVAAGAGEPRDILTQKPCPEFIIEPEQAIQDMLFDRFDQYQQLLQQTGNARETGLEEL